MRRAAATIAILAGSLSSAACAADAPPAAPAAARSTCAEVFSLELPTGFTCTPRASAPVSSVFVEGPRVRLLLLAAPNLSPGDSSTDRPLRAGERTRLLSFGGLAATAIVTPGELWESHLEVFVPDVGNGGDRLLALARWQATEDEATAADLVASTRIVRTPAAATPPDPTAPAAASGPATPVAAATPPIPGGDPAGWLRHVAGFQVSMAAPSDLKLAVHDPSEGPNLSLNGPAFEVHLYLSEEGVRAVTGRAADTVTSEPIVVDGPHGQLHRWKRAVPIRAGRPFELELQARLTPERHLSVFASCQSAAACGTAESILRSIRVIDRP
jgi:hypothetical protein